jgi:phosphoserine phosphatase
MAMAVTVDEIIERARALSATRAPSDAPLVAAFDADGTLWAGDVGEVAFERAAAFGMVDVETVRGPLAAFMTRYGLTLGEVRDASGVGRALAEIANALVDGTFERAGAALGQTRDDTLADVFSMQAWCYAGRTLEELHAFGRRIFDDDIAHTVFAHTRRLLPALGDLGFALAVVTASPDFLVRPALDALLSSDVRLLGMSTQFDGSRVAPASRDLVYGAGKVHAIVGAFGRAPALAFGDTVAGGDKDMLRSARVPVAVEPRGVHEAAAHAWPELLLLSTRTA